MAQVKVNHAGLVASSACPAVLCCNRHPVVKYKTKLKWHQRGQWQCDFCEKKLSRDEPRWRCEYHCDFDCCTACYDLKRSVVQVRNLPDNQISAPAPASQISPAATAPGGRAVNLKIDVEAAERGIAPVSIAPQTYPAAAPNAPLKANSALVKKKSREMIATEHLSLLGRLSQWICCSVPREREKVMPSIVRPDTEIVTLERGPSSGEIPSEHMGMEASLPGRMQSYKPFRDKVDPSNAFQTPVAVRSTSGFFATPRAAASADSVTLIRSPDAWWDEADTSAMGFMVTSRLKDSHLMRNKERKGPTDKSAPWRGAASFELYRRMGMRDPAQTYIATWMLLGNGAILTVAQVVDKEHFDSLINRGEQDILGHCLKLVINPIQVGVTLPAAATDPQQQDFVQKFLGKKGSAIEMMKTDDGVPFACFVIDFNATWLLQKLLLKVGFRQGHVLDLHVVDWPGTALFASGRLSVNQELLDVLN